MFANDLANFFGLYVPEAAFEGTFGEPFLSRHVVALENPGQSKEIAREIEGLLREGMSRLVELAAQGRTRRVI